MDIIHKQENKTVLLYLLRKFRNFVCLSFLGEPKARTDWHIRENEEYRQRLEKRIFIKQQIL